jgi:PEGA domain-containing protein
LGRSTLGVTHYGAESETNVIADEHRPRVFITNSESWEVVGSAAGSGRTFAARTQGDARPQTAEIIKTFGERCEQVIVNNRQEKADYIVVLDHEGGKRYLLRRNKIAVFNKDGDAIVSRSTRSLGNSVQDGCDAIVHDWAGHNTAAAPIASGSASFQSTPAKAEPEQRSAFVAPTAKRDLVVPAQAMSTPTPVPENLTSAASSANMGTASVTSDPDGAEIFIDSVGYGRAPAILKLSAGKLRSSWSDRATGIGPRSRGQEELDR